MREYIIKIDEDKKDIMGSCPLVEKPQELIRCKNCRHFDYCFTRPIDRDDWFCADGDRR